MVTARPRTVLTPHVPRATKPKAEVEERAPHPVIPGRRYRVRLTEESPFGGFDKPTYGDDLEPLAELHAANAAAGIGSILEEHMGAGYGMLRSRPVLTVEELGKMRPPLARPVTIMVPRKSGELREDTRWEISPKGQQMLLDSMRP